MRILLDTNVLISGLLRKDGPSGALLRDWVEAEFILVTSHYQADELRRVVQYDHLRSRIRPDQAAALFDNMKVMADVVSRLPDIDLSPDPKDNPILATAIAGNADLIVSGDKGHMLDLGSVQGIPIVNARDALTRLHGVGGTHGA